MRHRSVMVAFGGSPGAGLALAHACVIAQARLARLALVGVVAPPRLPAWQTTDGRPAVPSSDLRAHLETAADLAA